MGSSDPPLRDIPGLEPTSTPAGTVYRRPSAVTATPEPARSEPARPAPARLEPARPAPPVGGPDIDLTTRPRRFPPTRAVQAAPAVQRAQTPEEAVAAIRSLGGRGDLVGALEEADDAVARFPLDPEARYLRAVVLMESGRPADAAASAKAALYLDPELVMAHLALARSEAALDRPEAAARSLRTAVALLRALPDDAVVPMSDGESAGRLAAVAAASGDALAGTSGGRGAHR